MKSDGINGLAAVIELYYGCISGGILSVIEILLSDILGCSGNTLLIHQERTEQGPFGLIIMRHYSFDQILIQIGHLLFDLVYPDSEFGLNFGVKFDHDFGISGSPERFGQYDLLFVYAQAVLGF